MQRDKSAQSQAAKRDNHLGIQGRAQGANALVDHPDIVGNSGEYAPRVRVPSVIRRLETVTRSLVRQRESLVGTVSP